MRMFSGVSYKNANRVNLLYWHINPYVYDRICDNEWQGPNERFIKHVMHSPWWEWAKEKELEIFYIMDYLPLDDSYVYVAYTTMLPKDETFWRLKYEVIHKKDMD